MNRERTLKVSDEQSDPTAVLSNPTEEALLAPQRAFVVQFYPQSDPAIDHFVGRVEHVMSGQRCRFASIEALMAFVCQMLTSKDR